jgi:hypothetical protein
MDDEDDLIRRLHTLGTQPLEPAVSAKTLAAIRDAQRASVRRGTRFKVALAAMAGFFVGGLGLASAGALPADVQDAAQSVLERVGVNVPPGHERYNDPAVCPGGPYRNHGDYVRQHPDDPNAGASPCGKPVHAVDKSKSSDSSGPAEASEASEASGDNSGQGKGRDKVNGHDTESSDASSATEPAETESSDTESSSSGDEQPTASTADQSTASSP